MNQLFKFAIVGTLGFITDALVLLSFVHFFELSIELSRVISFLVAVFVTWFLNRTFTFSSKNKNVSKEYTLYFIIQTIGAILNYIIFISLVYLIPLFKIYLVIPLAIASLIVMAFNFIVIKKKVFN